MNRRKLQSLINRAAKTSTAFHNAQAALNDYCREVYGAEPGDLDCDDIIDGVLGGCGVCNGMTAEDFDASMKERLAVT